MTENSIILPIFFHLVTAVLLLFFWKKVKIQKMISIAAHTLILLLSLLLFWNTWSAGMITMQTGDWPAPFGITFVSDIFSSLLVVLTSIAGVAVAVYSTVGISTARIRYGYFPLLHFLLMGLVGAFLTGDIFNLYVWFEIIIISSFVLMTLGGRKPQIGGGIKYVAMNLLASIIFLTAIAILYGLTGSLNMADLAVKIRGVENQGLVNVTASLFFVAFGIKSAVFPLYFWLPSSYHTPPSAIAAIFAGLLTKVGVYALIRIFTLIFVPDEFTRNLILVIAVATLATGAFGAIVKTDLRQIFSYLIVCHIGFMIAGLGMFTVSSVKGSIYYLVHDIIVKTNVFLIAGFIFKTQGSVKLKELGGLYATHPRLSILFALVFFSLVGIPPLSGFWPKIWLVEGGFETDSFVTIGAILFASFITLVVIAKIWAEVFWKQKVVQAHIHYTSLETLPVYKQGALTGPIIFLAAVTLYIGLAANYIHVISEAAAMQLMNAEIYINAVMRP